MNFPKAFFFSPLYIVWEIRILKVPPLLLFWPAMFFSLLHSKSRSRQSPGELSFFQPLECLKPFCWFHTFKKNNKKMTKKWVCVCVGGLLSWHFGIDSNGVKSYGSDWLGDYVIHITVWNTTTKNTVGDRKGTYRFDFGWFRPEQHYGTAYGAVPPHTIHLHFSGCCCDIQHKPRKNRVHTSQINAWWKTLISRHFMFECLCWQKFNTIKYLPNISVCGQIQVFCIWLDTYAVCVRLLKLTVCCRSKPDRNKLNQSSCHTSSQGDMRCLSLKSQTTQLCPCT